MSNKRRLPLAVIQGRGKSHLTKEEIKIRQEQEEKARGFTDRIEPPSYLLKKQQEEFMEIANELIRLNIFSNLDVDTLARYIDSRSQYIELVKKIRNIKFDKNFKEYAQMQRTKNALFTECRQLANDLGLTITSRLKLVVPQIEKEETKSEFERKFGDV